MHCICSVYARLKLCLQNKVLLDILLANFERVLKIPIIILDIKNRKIKFENHELKSCVGLFNYRHVTFKLL